MAKDNKTNYLVFERWEPEEVMPPQGYSDKYGRIKATPAALMPYVAIGAVRASDASTAVQAVIKATRRVGAYAVLEATFIDFAEDAHAGDAIINTPLLGPGD